MIRRPKPPKKRRRVEDSSDDEIAEYALGSLDWLAMLTTVSGYNPRRQQGESHQHLLRSNNSWFGLRRMASRDAYMLVYMRRGAAPGGPLKIQQPPQRALDVVLQMNERHAIACDTFAKRSIAGIPLIEGANRLV